jgi:methyl-accepting chemotaxis protein
MYKIKIVGILVAIISIALAVISHDIDDQNRINSNSLERINEQKDSIQEISKNIFYIYRNKNCSINHLDKSIKKITLNMNDVENNKILLLWKDFYFQVNKFKEQIEVRTSYSSILLEKTITKIYSINLKLIIEFNKLISTHQEYYNSLLYKYRVLQYILFFVLSILLVYLFSQVKIIISFIQEFSTTSKSVIENSTIADLKPIELKNSNTELTKATDNFNFLVKKINQSIEYSQNSIEHTSKSLLQIEDNIEEFLTLLNSMDQNKNIDIEMAKKEDAVIQSLEELMNITKKLTNLRSNLKNLTSSS